MKTTAINLIELFSSKIVNSYSLNLFYNQSMTDDDTEFEAMESIIISFHETNTSLNIEISIEIPFCMNLLEIKNINLAYVSTEAILNIIKYNFDEAIPLLINNNYRALSRLICAYVS